MLPCNIILSRVLSILFVQRGLLCNYNSIYYITEWNLHGGYESEFGYKRGGLAKQEHRSKTARRTQPSKLHNLHIRFETRVYVNNGRSQECRCGWPGAGSAGLPSSLFP